MNKMANNRMYLLNRMTGKAVYLARFPAGSVTWEASKSPELTDALQQLFDLSEGSNDFCLAMEMTAGAPCAFGAWEYTEERGILRTLNVLPSAKVPAP